MNAMNEKEPNKNNITNEEMKTRYEHMKLVLERFYANQCYKCGSSSDVIYNGECFHCGEKFIDVPCMILKQLWKIATSDK